ncbi:autotransporter family protein [Phascolarctobacterium faecium]
MKRLKVTGKELALLCGMAALGTLTLPLGAAARTVDSVTATAGSTAEIVYSGETLTVTNGVESIGNNATGIRAVDDTEVAIGKDIYVHGANSQYNNSYGVYGDSGVQVKVGTDIVVESDAGAERVRGIYIDGGYGSSISSTPDIQVGGNISASGINTIGIYVSGKNANIKVDGNVTASNRNATGITTGGTSKIYVGGDVISSYDNNGTLSYGISVGAGNDSYVEVAGNIVASGKLTSGVRMGGSGTNKQIKVGKSVVAGGESSKGIDTNGDGVSAYVAGDVTANGKSSLGIIVQNDAQVTVDGNLKASGEGAKGVELRDGSSVTVGKNIEVSGTEAIGINVDRWNVTGSAAADSIGVDASNSSVTIVGASSIEGTGSTGVLLRKNDAALTMSGLMTVNGANAIGIDIKTSGIKAALDGPGSVQVSGTDAVGIKLGSGTETTIDSWNLNVADISAGAGIELGNNSKLELKNVASQAAADGVLLRAAGTATVNVDGSSHLVGDVLHDGTVSGTLALAFAEGSSLTGKVNEQGAGVINLEMDNAVWKLSGDSSLHQLTLNNGAAVHLTHSGGYHTLTAQELQGSGGLFKLDVDVRSLESDKLAITDASSGSHVLDIYQKDAYEPSAGSTEGHGLVLGSVTGTADFTAKDREGSLFYKHYELGSKASETAGYDTDWYLDKIISVDPGDKTTTTVKTIMGAAALNYHTWRTDNDQLLQRLGDLRQSGDDENGVWLRLKGTKISRNGRFSFENKYTTYELGYDKVLRQTDDYTRYGGVAFSYGDGSSSYAGGSGSNHNKAIGLYGTQINKKGHYLDLVLKYSDMDNDFSVLDTEGKKISGDYDNKGLAFSAEYGRKNALQRGWYIEPQAQLTLGYLDGGSYFTSNRVKVEQSHIKSVLGRVGFQLGRDIDAKTNIYIKADLLHEFGGGYDVKMTAANGDSLYQSADFDDTWVEYGIGAAIRTGHNNHLYFDVERTAGSDFKKDWQWNIGARWEF